MITRVSKGNWDLTGHNGAAIHLDGVKLDKDNFDESTTNGVTKAFPIEKMREVLAHPEKTIELVRTDEFLE